MKDNSFSWKHVLFDPYLELSIPSPLPAKTKTKKQHQQKILNLRKIPINASTFNNSKHISTTSFMNLSKTGKIVKFKPSKNTLLHIPVLYVLFKACSPKLKVHLLYYTRSKRHLDRNGNMANSWINDVYFYNVQLFTFLSQHDCILECWHFGMFTYNRGRGGTWYEWGMRNGPQSPTPFPGIVPKIHVGTNIWDFSKKYILVSIFKILVKTEKLTNF